MTIEQRWDNAIHRAIEIDGEHAARYVGRGRFLIASASDPERGAYEVKLDLSIRDRKVECSCRAGELGFPCWHAATALLMAGLADAPADDDAHAA